MNKKYLIFISFCTLLILSLSCVNSAIINNETNQLNQYDQYNDSLNSLFYHFSKYHNDKNNFTLLSIKDKTKTEYDSSKLNKS